LLKKHPKCLLDRKIFLSRQKLVLPFRADQETHRVSPPGQRPRSRQDGLDKCNEGQRPTRRVRSARRGRGGRWPVALATGWRAARAPHGRGDGPGQNMRGARKTFMFSGQQPMWLPRFLRPSS